MSDFDRGKREGRVDALLESHSRSILAIGEDVKRIVGSVSTLSSTLEGALDKLSDGLRTMQEEGRARDLAVAVAAETLAKETERRRIEEERLRSERATALEVPVRTWGIRSNKASLLSVAIGLAVVLVSVYFGTRHGITLSPTPTVTTP